MASYHDAWVITPEEKIKHESQFYMMNPVAGFLSGEQVKGFFLKSGLPQAVLGKIWQLSDINADGKMDKREFSIAMHLIKKALQGFDIPPMLPSTLLSSPPMGNSFNPSINSGMVGPTFGMQPNPALLYSSATLPYPGGSVALMSGDPRNFSTIAKPPSSATLGGEWSISPAQRLKYKQLFNNHDASHKGYLTGLEAKGVLSQSGLTHPILAQIWSLADIDTDGNLSPDEFCVAMFLIDQAKSGFPIPPVLPLDLVPPSYRKSRRPSESVGVGLPLPSSNAIATTKPGLFNELNANVAAVNLNMSGSETNSAMFLESDVQRIITFEDKRKENFDKGQAELEKRRAMLRDQQLQESEERIAAERAEHEKREKIRQDQELKRQIEQERQLERQRQVEMEKEEQRRKLLEQKESARKELERQRQLEWEKQRRDQLMADKSREQNLVDDLRHETGQQKLKFESLQAKKSELMGKIEQSKMNISEMSNFIQSLKHSSLSKTTEIDVLKAELEEVEMKLVAVQQESLRLGKQFNNTSNGLADHSLGNLVKDHSRVKERMEELKKKIEIIESTCQNKKTQIAQLEIKVEQVRKMCDGKQAKNDLQPQATRDFDLGFPSSVSHQENGNAWGDVHGIEVDSNSLFDDTVNWSGAFPSDDSAPRGDKQDLDAWEAFGANEPAVEQDQAATWAADFNSIPKVTMSDPASSDDAGTAQKYKALYRFDAKNPDELSLVEGDVVLVHARDQAKAEPGWMIGSLNGRTGCFPVTYVRLVSTSSVVDQMRSSPGDSMGAYGERIDLTLTAESPSFNATTLSSSDPNSMDSEQMKAQAIYPWQAKKDNQLSFAKGDVITVLNQQEMWWFGELDGTVGWFPKSYIKVFGEPDMGYSHTPPELSLEFSSVKQPILPHEPPSDLSHNSKKRNLEEFIVVAMFTYSSNVPGDLTFNQGDVFPAQKTDEEWWTGTLNDVTGIFPASYVQQMETLIKKKPQRPSKPPSVNASKLQENRKPEIASVIAAYPATGPEQLTLQPGQLIHVRKKSPSGWWEGELQVKGQRRRIGWFPANYVKLLGTSNSNTPEPDAQESLKEDVKRNSHIGQAMALYAYTGQTNEDLSFQEGVVINLLEKTSDDWWKGELNGSVGIFPANYVTLLPQKSLNFSSLNALS